MMENLIIAIFIIGYAAIAIEHSLHINKAALALLTGVLCWTAYIMNSPDPHIINHQLTEHLGEISGILFFLLGAMTIVELIDAHEGFDIITHKIKTTNKKQLLWIVCILTFFLSAILDNLTTSIVMVTLLRKLIKDQDDRKLFLGMVIIAANAGGAWSPIGDVTTTMLWIGGQVTSSTIILKLLLPSLVCTLVPLLIVSFSIKGTAERTEVEETLPQHTINPFEKHFVFFAGVGVLIFVPIFKTITHLPPYMGILMGVGLLWVITELLHRRKDDEEKSKFSVVHAIRKSDVPSVLFFLGILISIAVLQSTGILGQLATYMDQKIGNQNLITISIGLLSSIVDNVPMVAGAMGMYSMEQFPADHNFWSFLAYCAGTGGSALIIGSAAGVAVMGMEKIDFFWYIKKITWLALIGYLSGAGVYLLQESLF